MEVSRAGSAASSRERLGRPPWDDDDDDDEGDDKDRTTTLR